MIDGKTEEEITDIEQWINRYPRKIHSYHTAAPVFYCLNVVSTIAVLYAAYVQIKKARPAVLIVTVVGYAVVIGFTQYHRKKGYVHLTEGIDIE